MQLINRILLFTPLLVATVYCQGGGGGGGGGGSGGGGSGGGGFYGGRGSSCTGDNCGLVGIIVGSVLGGIFAIVLVVWGVCCCCKHFRGKPRRSNSVFVINATEKNKDQDMYDMQIFHPGFWTSRYFQYGRWHGPHRFVISFDPQAFKISGTGRDDVGKFSIDGTYSPKTRRIALTKTYQRGTGNPSENLGHPVTIQLEWNPDESQFEGKWYVQTHKFHGEDKFELKFDGQEPPPPYEKV